MSRSKRDILDTERMLERLMNTLSAHDPHRPNPASVYRTDAEALRRISMTLHNWHELECNVDIQRRGDKQRPFVVRQTHKNASYAYQIPDREAGALKRLKKIMARYPALRAYVQTDPRGCALYILKPGDVSRAGYRAAWNIHHNIGCFIRPDDENSFSPAKVFKTEVEAWADFEREHVSSCYSRGLAVFR